MQINPQTLSLLKGLIPTKDDKDQGPSPDHLEKIYIFCVMWSVGALLELEDRAKLEAFIRGNAELRLHLPVLPPGSDHTMFDYFVNNEGRFQWLASFAFHPVCFIFITGLISSYCKRCYFRRINFSRLVAQKHIRGLLNSRWADAHLSCLYYACRLVILYCTK